MWARLAVVLVCGVLALGVQDAAPAGPDEPPANAGLTGQLLVATTDMPDPRFARTVIYMIRHDGTGAEGVVLNRPLGDIPLATLLQQMRMESAGVTATVHLHAGGPVNPLGVLILHTADYAREGTRVIKDGIALTQEPQILDAIARGKGPRRTFFALGYAGWGPGQLEAEMKAGGWVRAIADEAIVFDSDYEHKWERAMDRRRIDL
jgi:putative transcriptional regulator